MSRRRLFARILLVLWGMGSTFLVSAFPIYSAGELIEYCREGGGPAGLGVLGFVMVVCTLLSVMSLVNSLLFVWSLNWRFSRKLLLAASAACLLPFALGVAGLILCEGLFSGFYLFYGILAASVLLNLAALGAVLFRR